MGNSAPDPCHPGGSILDPMQRSPGPLRRPGREDAPLSFAVVGLGLMGGSLALALAKAYPGCRVVGVETRSDRRLEAIGLGIASEVLPSIRTLDASEHDLVFLATPVGTLGSLLRELARTSSGPALLVDLGSVKQSVYQDLGGALPEGIHFVGGHPMTGSALEGLEGADPHLYENAVFVLTHGDHVPEAYLSAIHSVLEGLGALVMTMDPRSHDEAVSTISHLPYLLAVALVELLRLRHGDTGGMAAQIAAGGFHGATRVATCTPEVFRDIVVANRVPIQGDLARLREILDGFSSQLAEVDADGLQDRFRRAQQFRRTLPQLRKGILPSLPEAIVKARDQPGFIGQVATMIGAAGVNIRDLEVLHSREGEGGTLRLAFENPDDRARALRILDAAGFVASERDD